ncbi:MAG: MmcQ/YjbR family DNA-binding protein [Gaiellaceae bacterium]
MTDWETVREIALAFPEVAEDTSGRRAFRVRGKLFAWEARERDGGGLGVRVDPEEKQLILDANLDVYFSSPHYDGWPGVQIRLELIGRDELRERLEDAWLIQAPKRLATEYLGANPS